MARVTMRNPGAPTPSQRILAAAAREVEVASADGRRIALRKPAPLARLDFARAAGGAELNQLYLAEVMHLPYVAAIDGEPVASPATEGELRALYARLGDEGNEAAQRGVLDHFLPPGIEAEEAALKNG